MSGEISGPSNVTDAIVSRVKQAIYVTSGSSEDGQREPIVIDSVTLNQYAAKSDVYKKPTTEEQAFNSKMLQLYRYVISELDGQEAAVAIATGNYENLSPELQETLAANLAILKKSDTSYWGEEQVSQRIADTVMTYCRNHPQKREAVIATLTSVSDRFGATTSETVRTTLSLAEVKVRRAKV